MVKQALINLMIDPTPCCFKQVRDISRSIGGRQVVFILLTNQLRQKSFTDVTQIEPVALHQAHTIRIDSCFAI